MSNYVDDLFSGNDISLLVAAAASPGPVTVSVCSSNYAGDCCGVYTNTIQVKFCPGTGGDSDYYVYQLKNVPICDMAYCAVKGMEAAPPSRKHSSALLWSPYGIGQTIIFSCCRLLWPPCVADADVIFLPLSLIHI